MASPTQETERKRLNKKIKLQKNRTKKSLKTIKKLQAQGRILD